MRIDRNLRNRQTLAALMLLGAPALLLSPAAALAQAAGQDSSVTRAAGPQDPAETVFQVRDLMDAGRLIEAKATLDRLVNSDAASQMSTALQGRVQTLAGELNARIMKADPSEISIQKAELSLNSGDLVNAKRQASAAAGKAPAGSSLAVRAAAVLAAIEKRQQEIAPMVSGRIEQATKDFDAHKYAESKAAIDEVQRSGVQLSADQSATLERAKTQILNLEAANGAPFPIGAAAGMGTMDQPGTVRRTRGGSGAEPGHAEPLPAGVSNDQPAATPAPEAAPAPAPQPQDAPPAAQPAPVPPPPPPASQQDDIITAALRLEAQHVIAEGDASYDAARWNDAISKYSIALAQYRAYIGADDAARVQKRIDEARLKAGAGSTNDLANNVTMDWTLVRSRAQAEFDDDMKQADAALAGGDPGKASDKMAAARLAVSNAKQYFNESESAAFDKQIAAMKAKIEGARDKISQAAADAQTQKLADETKKAESNRLAERERKINQNIDRIRALQREKKYAEALQIVDQTLFIDPNDPTTLLLRDIISDMLVYDRFEEVQRVKQSHHAAQQLQDQEAIIAPAGIMDFPLDWPNKSYQRGELAAYAETPENRQVLAQMTSPAKKIPLDLAENRFEDVLKFVASVTQLTIDPDWESLAAVGVEKDTPVTLKLQTKVTIQAALERILAKVSKDQYSRAGWAVSDGVVNVASEEALRKHKVLVIYNIQDLLFQIPNYTQVPQIDLNSVLQSNTGGGGQSPFRNDDNNQNQKEDPAVRERRVRQIIDIIYANVDFEGWKDNGGETGSLQELNGSLIITNTPRNHREIVGLLSKLREIRNMQINVETKFLLVNQDWFEQIGFDIDLVFNAHSNQVTNAQANDPSVVPSDFFKYGSATTTQGLQRQITGAGAPTIAGGTTPAAQGTVAPNKLSPVGVSSNSLGLTTSLSEGDFASAVLKQAPALGIAGQFLDDVEVDFLVTATQADKRTVSLTAPRLTFTNGQTANIYVATQEAFVSQLTPVVGDSAVGFNPMTSVVSEGVTMLIEGVISSDRRYVTMNVDSGVSRIDQIRQSPVTAIAGGQLVNSGSTQSFIELPEVTVTRVRTTATVPDEGTLLLGGQRLVTEVEVETGVPVLSKIPILNRFFTNRLEDKEEQSLLILVKPTILIQTEEEEKSFPGLNDQIRSGLGLR